MQRTRLPTPQPGAPAQPQPIVVAAGTAVTVRLTDELRLQTNQAGQTFSATTDKDVIVDGQTAIPAGSNVTGTVVTQGRTAGWRARLFWFCA